MNITRNDIDFLVVPAAELPEEMVAGPDPKTLIDPIHPADLRRALVNLLRGWWSLQIEDSSLLQKRGYQVYAIKTMCRALYTLEYGTIVSKPAAARWAMETLDDRWAALIGRAMRRDVSPATLGETLGFIRYTVEMTGSPTSIIRPAGGR